MMRQWQIRQLLEIAAAVALTAAALVFMVARPAAGETAASGIAVEQAWARPSIGLADSGAVYMTVHNAGPGDDALLKAQGDIARAFELHAHIRDGDIVRMRRIEGGIELPAGAAVVLAPGGQHVMLIGLARPLKEGEHFALTLHFWNAGAVTVQVAVRASAPSGDPRGHHHHGHRH